MPPELDCKVGLLISYNCPQGFATCDMYKMAARGHAATSHSPKNAVFCSLRKCLSGQSTSEYMYNRRALLPIRKSKICLVLTTETKTLRELGILRRPANSPESPATAPPEKRHRKRCARSRKRGKRGCVRARLEVKPTRPAIPSIILANVQPLDNKMDYIRHLRSTNRKVSDCCVLVFTETWINENIPDSAIQLEQLACYRGDRDLAEGGKTLGGGVCVYIRDAWCRDAAYRQECENQQTSSERGENMARGSYLGPTRLATQQ